MNKIEMEIYLCQKKYYENWCEFLINNIPYRVDKCGKIQTKLRAKYLSTTYLHEEWKERNPYFGKCDYTGAGYYFTTIASRQIRIHRLVAICFIGEIKKGMEINHIDSNRKNNSIENIEIISHKENMAKIKYKDDFNTFSGKLKEKELIGILKLIKSGKRNIDIAKIYKVDPSNISRIRDGSWPGLRLVRKSVDLSDLDLEKLIGIEEHSDTSENDL